MGNLSLREAAALCGGTVAPEYERITFFGASADSRAITPGQLFVALNGARDGHDFAPMAMERGAAAVLGAHPVGDLPVLVADDPLKALGEIARGWRERLKTKVVGITGSVGKTTTKEMTAKVLGAAGPVHKTAANFNNHIGLPVTVLGIPEDCPTAVVEMGMNHFGEIAALTRIAQPDFAVITNIGTMHIENLGSREGILRAKLEILEGLRPGGTAIFNGDEPLLRAAQVTPKPIFFGLGEDNDLRACEVQTAPGRMRFRCVGLGADIPVTLPVEGRHHVSDALAAIAVGLCCGLAPEQIAAALASFENTGDRQRTFEKDGLTVIADCYNAGPESTAAALEVLAARQTEGRRIAVLGDMLELGEAGPDAHRQTGALAAKRADLLYCYGPLSEHTCDGARAAGLPPDRVFHFDRQDVLAEALRAEARPGDVLLFKGSHGMHMERVIALLLPE